MISKLLKRSKKKVDVAICCIAKNEDQYIIEWLTYHLNLGISKIYIYDNESQFPIEHQAVDFVKAGRVKVINYPGNSMQFSAYQHCLGRFGASHDWIAFIDVDEFIFPKTTNGDLPAFLESYSEYGGLGINWRAFGSNQHIKKPEVSQFKAFTRRAAKHSEISQHIKSIVQPRHVIGVGSDPHHFIYKKKKFCVNEAFEKIDGPFHPHSSNLIQLNHYITRSFEEFQLKIARGRADMTQGRLLEEFYKFDCECDEVNDEGLLEFITEKRREKISRLIGTSLENAT